MSVKKGVPSICIFHDNPVLKDEIISPGAKLTYGEIFSMCQSKKADWCWLTNRHVAKLFGVEPRTIQNHLFELECAGYIWRGFESLNRRQINLGKRVIKVREDNDNPFLEE